MYNIPKTLTAAAIGLVLMTARTAYGYDSSTNATAAVSNATAAVASDEPPVRCPFPPIDFGVKVPKPEECKPMPWEVHDTPSGQPRPAPPLPPTVKGLLSDQFVVDYNQEQVAVLSQNAFSIKLDLNATRPVNGDPKGARIATKFAYESGKIAARVKSGASVPGIVGSFYLSNYEPERKEERVQYEVDFEFMGARGHRYVQTNVFTNGAGGEEVFHPIPDHDSQFHLYEIEWDVKAGFAELSVDGKQVRCVDITGWPAQRVYLSFWGTKTCNTLNNLPFVNWAGLPRAGDYGKTYVMNVTDIQFTPGKAVPVKPDYRLKPKVSVHHFFYF